MWFINGIRQMMEWQDRGQEKRARQISDAP
jgi:hypothetical protein